MLPRDVTTRDGRRCHLREQREADAAAIIALAPGAHSLLEEQVAVAASRTEGGLGVVAEALGDGVVGHLVVAGPRRADGGGEVAIFVVNSWRNAGLGGMLLEVAVDWGRRAGLANLRVRVESDNVAARHLYEKLGFVMTPALDEPGRVLVLAL